MQSRFDTQFTKASCIVQHRGCYVGKMGEVSFDKVNKRLILHNGCTPNGIAFAQMEDTECAPKTER